MSELETESKWHITFLDESSNSNFIPSILLLLKLISVDVLYNTKACSLLKTYSYFKSINNVGLDWFCVAENELILLFIEFSGDTPEIIVPSVESSNEASARLFWQILLLRG